MRRNTIKTAYDLSLYLVTKKDNIPLEKFFRIILDSIAGGVTVVQLREKKASFEETVKLGKQLLNLLKPLNVPLIINDRVDVAFAIGAQGVHLGQSDFSVPLARTFLGKNAIIGLSVGNTEQVKNALEMQVDYVAASPVFPTVSKTDCKGHIGIEGIKQICAVSTVPVVAIGGINESNVENVLHAGAAGVAVISAIFGAPCPKAAALKIKSNM